MNPLEEVRFWTQIIEDSRRVILCSPDDQLVAELATAGVPGVEVRVHAWLDKGQVIVCDVNAVEASARQALQRSWP